MRHNLTLSFSLIITKQKSDHSKNNELWLEHYGAMFYANIMMDNHDS